MIRSMKRTLIDILTSAILGIGLLLLATPFFLWWFLGGDMERRWWVTHGPYPLSEFGSGPFFIATVALIFFLGLILLFIAWIMRKRIK